MSIWDYKYKENVKITTDDGQVFQGTVIDIMDIDEAGNTEPMVSIETDHGIFGLWESEIEKIETIDNKEFKRGDQW